MPRRTDTIAALATPTGSSALAVLRVSGSDTESLATAILGAPPSPRRVRLVDYRSAKGDILDEVLLTFFRGPNSYTGEDALEISCHGNPFIAQKILEDMLARECRLAEPGEFTQRAFLNGKMDLSQAEAVMDLIHARSERALAAANQQLRGALGRRMEGLIAELLGVLARIEAYIDFPDEDLPVEDRTDVIARIDRIKLDNNKLLATSHYGSLLRDGIKTVIIGAPNAGKSSLLNRLVGRERALVSPEPGTTRDFIEERIIIGPHCLRLIDTAGFNLSPAPLERLGIAKTLERTEEADLFLVVVDATDPAPLPFPAPLREKLQRTPTLVAFNKTDLCPDAKLATDIPHSASVSISALTGAGLEKLEQLIVAEAEKFRSDPHDMVAISARHAHALEQARECLEDAERKLRSGGPIELVASDLRGVMAAFGEITGRIDNERMLDALFATFCIGK